MLRSRRRWRIARGEASLSLRSRSGLDRGHPGPRREGAPSGSGTWETLLPARRRGDGSSCSNRHATGRSRDQVALPADSCNSMVPSVSRGKVRRVLMSAVDTHRAGSSQVRFPGHIRARARGSWRFERGLERRLPGSEVTQLRVEGLGEWARLLAQRVTTAHYTRLSPLGLLDSEKFLVPSPTWRRCESEISSARRGANCTVRRGRRAPDDESRGQPDLQGVRRLIEQCEAELPGDPSLLQGGLPHSSKVD